MTEQLPFFTGITIDDVTSFDLDDGFWIEEKETFYLLRIFISNVANVVHPHAKNLKLYEIARQRTRTQYYAKRHDPMLPLNLSEDKLSLVPYKNRKAICFEFRLNLQSYAVEYFNLYECMFKSVQKLSYNTVHRFLTSQPIDYKINSEVKKVLVTAYPIAFRFLQQRRDMGGLIVYDAENTFAFNEEEKLVLIEKDKHHGYILVQELMILCNAAVAKFAVEQKIPFIFRTHKIKDPHFDKADLLREFSMLKGTPEPRMLSVFQQRIYQILEAATYSVKHGEHWALSLPWYAHITSPIRRFADLVNQVNLLAYLRKQPEYPFLREELEEIIIHIHETTERQDKNRQMYAEQASSVDLNALTPQWLESLSPNALYKILIMVSNSDGIPSDPLISEITKRIDEDRLDVRDFALLLFDHRFVGQELIRIKSLGLLVLNKVRVKPVLNHFCQRMRLVPPAIVFGKDKDQFWAKATFKLGETTYATDSGIGKSKREASENAHLLLFAKICKIDLADFIQTTIPPEKVVAMKNKAPKVFALTEVLDGNYISALQESAQEAGIAITVFTFTEVPFISKSVAQQFVFRCVAEMTVNDKKITASKKATNKKLAKAAAAKALYGKIKQGL